MRLIQITLSAMLVTLLAACSSTPEKQPETGLAPGQSKLVFEESAFDKVPTVEDWEPALKAFKLSCSKLTAKAEWQSVCQVAQSTAVGQAETFFKSYFVPYRAVAVSRGADQTIKITDEGKMTGYYEPVLYGSRQKKKPYVYPLHTMPDDLITVKLDELYPQLKGLRLRGQVKGQTLVPYDTRAQLSKRNLDQFAIAWVEDPVDAFFLQIQGSGRIVLPDGSFMRVGYGDVNGHPYRGIGSYLVSQGYLKSHELSMQSIRAWAKKNPRQLQTVLNQNPSYVFFVERKDQDPSQGPIGAQGVPLTDKGSVAVDRRYYEMGWPIVVDVEQTNPDMKFTQAVVAQDTGGAIRGPIRFDFYWGSGYDAGEAAGKQNSKVKAWVLLPKGMQPPLK